MLREMIICKSMTPSVPVFLDGNSFFVALPFETLPTKAAVIFKVILLFVL